MRARFVGALLVLVVVTVGCGGADDGAAEPRPSPSASPSQLTSHRLGYTMPVPSGWTAEEGFTAWPNGIEPHRGAPAFDTYRSADDDPWFLVGRQGLRDRTLATWVERLQSSDTITYPHLCEPAQREPDSTLGGEPAWVFSIHCPDDSPEAVGVMVLAAHGSFGYLLLCYSEEAAGGEASTLVEECEAWRREFAFV
jgi:hypothetical protein